MPAYWLNHNGQRILQPICVTSLEFGKHFLRTGQSESGGHRGAYIALYDTGATCTCISSRVVKDLNLPIRGKTAVSGVTGMSEEAIYRFHIGFTNIVIEEGDQLNFSNFSLLNVPVTGYCLTANQELWQGFDVILGMDILSRGILTINSNGTGSFSI